MDTSQSPRPRNPALALSVYELTLLFDDHPTVGLIDAICQQTTPPLKRNLLAAMYGMPAAGPLPEWFADRISDAQARMIDLGYSTWKLAKKESA